LLTTITSTIQSMKKDSKIKDADLYNSFDSNEMNKYKDEAKERWGHTEAYKQSQERTKNWKKEDYKKIQNNNNKLNQALAEAMDKGIESPEVQALVKQHHDGMKIFYDCGCKMYRNLGEMYIADPRFTATYDKFRPGLALFLKDAISYYCDQHE